MAFEGRRIVAGFSTGDYGIVSLPPLEGKGAGDAPSLGDLFSLPLPIAEKASKAGGGSALGGLGTFGLSGVGAGLGALSGLALGKKLEKNGVVGVPRLKGKTGKGKMPQRSASGTMSEEKGETDWLWGKEWGWDDDKLEDVREVLVVRDSEFVSIRSAYSADAVHSKLLADIALPVSANGKPRTSAPSAITYPSPIDETIILPPYVVSLLAPPPPAPTAPQTPTAPHTLAVHAFETLSSIQSLSVPPQSVTPPSSDGSSKSASIPHSARLLTASPSSAQPPVLLITSPQPQVGANPTASPEQTLWIGTMQSWEEQIEELGQSGNWEEAIRLLRQSPGLNGRASLPVS